MTPVRGILSGPSARRAYDNLVHKQRKSDEYPYDWLTPPPESIRVHQKGSIAPPASGVANETQVLSYQVPANMTLWVTALLQLLIGGAANTPGDGQIAWNWTVDTIVGATTSLQGYYVQGFSEVFAAGTSNFPLGNFQGGLNSPWQLGRAEEIGPEKTIRNTVIVNATVSAGGGRFVSLFEGYLVKCRQ